MEESLKVTLSFPKLVCEINSWVHISDTGKQVKLCVTAASSPEPLLAPL